MDDDTLNRISQALGRIPSGCAILTARIGTQGHGMLVSWMQQAAFSPPMISIAVRKGRAIERAIDASNAFVINLIGENPTKLFKHFGKGFDEGQNPFAGLAVKEAEGGIVLLDGIAWLSARVRGKLEAGDHWLYLGELVDAGIEGKPQPYVHLRNNGLNY